MDHINPILYKKNLQQTLLDSTHIIQIFSYLKHIDAVLPGHIKHIDAVLPGRIKHLSD